MFKGTIFRKYFKRRSALADGRGFAMLAQRIIIKLSITASNRLSLEKSTICIGTLYIIVCYSKTKNIHKQAHWLMSVSRYTECIEPAVSSRWFPPWNSDPGPVPEKATGDSLHVAA